MNRYVQKLVFSTLLIALVGCSALPGASQGGQTVASNKPRASAPQATDQEIATLVSGNSAFALDLYRRIKEREGNLFYSPYSVSLALAMTYAGARGETAHQMAEALHFELPPEELHPAFNALDLELAQRGEGAQGKDGEPFRLHIVNAIWGQRDYGFQEEFLDVLAENYGAGLRTLDFAGDPEEARATINDWVAEQTEERIEDLLPPGSIGALTRLVLTNAIYFNAAWKHPFEPERTADGPFYRLDGSEVQVPMMHQTEFLGYTEEEGVQVVELPYDGQEFSMVILLPERGTFGAFEDALTAERVDTIVEDLAYRQIKLSMPKFEFDFDLSLVQALQELGMENAFGAEADFSGMTGSPELFISEVVHKAFVSVDEEGTEAAAATAVVIAETAMPEEPLAVDVDRPFIFLIRDIETGTILFAGRIVDPGA
jgi:serpin B